MAIESSKLKQEQERSCSEVIEESETQHVYFDLIMSHTLMAFNL